MAKYTLTFADLGEKRGWTSFWDYHPELTLALGNKFYSFWRGQLYEHNDQSNPIRNLIYDKALVSEIVTILNQENDEDKIFKTIVIEGDDSWNVDIKTNLSRSHIKKEEFNKRESKYYAHIRKNENELDYTDRVQGIGILDSISGNTIFFSAKVPFLVNTGEDLYQLSNGAQKKIGNIVSISDNSISVDQIINEPAPESFCFSIKNARIQGSEIRGYFAEITLRNDSSKSVELYAINSNVVMSYAKTKN